MKNLKKILTFALAAMMCVPAVACGDSTTSEPEVTEDGRRILKFEFLRAGYGLEGYQAMANAFMEENPDVLVKLIPNYNINSTTSTKLEANNNLSDVFLLTSGSDIRRWAIKGWVEPLNDVYTAEVTEGVTLEESMVYSAREDAKYNDTYYSLPEYVSINGFVYNKGMFEEYGWEIPETTKDLEALCNKIKSDTNGSVAPFVYCGAAAQGYLYFAVENWIVQYEGAENMDEFYRFESPEVFNPENSWGKKYAMDNLQKFFFDNEGQYCLKGSMGKDHIEAQTDFLQGKAAMMLNGSWFQTEMKDILKEYPEFKLGMMKVPAMSDSAGDVMHADGYVAQKDDDGNDMGYVNSGVGAYYFIPKNATNKEDAKAFLKFINRPDICELYTSYTNAVRPMAYNKDPSSEAYANMSTFCKDVLSISNTNFTYSDYTHSPIALMGYISLWPQGNNWNYKIYENPITYTSSYCVNSDYEYVLKNWSYWQSLIGG